MHYKLSHLRRAGVSAAMAVAALGTSAPWSAQAAPTVSFKAPTSGRTLSGSIVQSSACEVTGSNIKQVRFYLGSTALNTENYSPWNCDIDTRKFTNGTHTLRAVAYDSAGRTASTQVSVNIQNSGAPTVSFKRPTSGATLSGAIAQSSACEVTGSNIANVQFYLGSTALNRELNAPWNCDIDTRKFPNGSHTLRAVARNSAGTTASTQISVNIQNSTTSTTSTTSSSGSTSTSTSSIASADVIGWASGNVAFSQQGGYSGQVLGTHPAASSIPESGIHGKTLSNGETLRLGKQTDPASSARKALAFQLAWSDPITSGNRRSELSFQKNIDPNKVYWIAFRAYVRDWGNDSSSGLFGTQVHSGDNSRGLSPSFGIYTAGARNFRIETRYSTSSSPSQSNSITVRHAERPIPFGRWVDFVFKFRHNTSGSGFLQAWMDGTQIVDYRGHLGFRTPGYRDYAKFGIYHWASFNNPRKVLLHNPTIVLDPTGSKYSVAALRTHVNR
jgi:hypothetical protein